MNEQFGILTVKVFSPFEIFYEGKARALTARNSVGVFDILPGHTNFMTLLESGTVRILTEIDERSFIIEHGFLKVTSNHVVLFADI
ncbi:hypothetical protein KBC99_00895 [Candidatus Saccharibacteria bacterium]|nr:hypothetical protein [Candidatus Saccharibacteria bacterium]